jgi:hypothetical protein
MSRVLLDPNGDFRIDEELSLATTTCDSPGLLIRNAANLTWFVLSFAPTPSSGRREVRVPG